LHPGEKPGWKEVCEESKEGVEDGEGTWNENVDPVGGAKGEQAVGPFGEAGCETEAGMQISSEGEDIMGDAEEKRRSG
jgi:hypothetical protein